MPYHKVTCFGFQTDIYYVCVVFGFGLVTGNIYVLTHLIKQVILQVCVCGHKCPSECSLKPLRITGITSYQITWSPTEITLPVSQLG